MPTRQMLDALVPDRPAYLDRLRRPHRLGEHARRCKLAGITRRTKAPANGMIVKDPRTGEPTGALKEAAMALMSDGGAAADRGRSARRDPRRRSTKRTASALPACRTPAARPSDLELYDGLRKRGELTLRVYQALSRGRRRSPRPDSTQLDAVRSVSPTTRCSRPARSS